ncbi:MAG: glycerophosphodiester phosphodiesterase family protein [Thermomicrobiales bacterium]
MMDGGRQDAREGRVTRPLIVAHRMMTGDGIENARSSLGRLVAAGADMAEIDIRLSLDRKPVVLHDAMLGRTTRGRGWIGLWPAAAIRRLPLRSVPQERVSLLSDILGALPAGQQIALHLKDRRALRPVLRQVDRLQLVAQTWLWLDRVADVQIARAALPEIRCTLLRPAAWREPQRSSYFADAQRCGARGVSVQPGAIDAGVVAQGARHGLTLFTRIDATDRLDHLLRAGVGGIITDDPAGVRAAVDRLLHSTGETAIPEW